MPFQDTELARDAVRISWANTEDRSERTEAGRRANQERLKRRREERRRAERIICEIEAFADVLTDEQRGRLAIVAVTRR